MHRLISFACFLPLVLAPVLCDAQPPVAEKSTIDPYLVIERFNIFSSDGAIMLPVQVGDRACRFMVDTGAMMSVVDKSLVVGAKAITKGFDGAKREPVELFAMPAGSLGKLDLKTVAPTVAAFDLSKISELAGYEIAGVLGFDFFANRIVQIDFDREEFLILNKIPEDVGQKFRVAFKDPSRPSIKIKVAESRTEDFLIDTGAIGFDSGCLRPKLCEALLEDSKARIVGQTLHQTVGGTSTSRLVQTRQISIGEITTTQPVFGEAGENLLSLNYLSRYCVTFELGRSRVYLKEGKRFRQPDLVDRSGLHIVRRDAQAMIHSVDAGSAAANAGIVSGDRLLFLGDIRGDTGPLHMMRGVLCNPDITVPVVIRRADREFMISLRLGPATLEPPK